MRFLIFILCTFLLVSNLTYAHAQIGPPLKLNSTSPLQQFKMGFAANNVFCKVGFKLVIKAEDGSPACVKPDTAKILIERGWAKAIQ